MENEAQNGCRPARLTDSSNHPKAENAWGYEGDDFCSTVITCGVWLSELIDITLLMCNSWMEEISGYVADEVMVGTRRRWR